MDAFTHALMGAHAAHLGTRPDARLSPRTRLLLGGVAAAFPDVDFIGFLVDPLRFLAYWHQGPTHSLLLLPLWALLIAAAYCAATRRWRAFGEAVAVCGAGLATHLVLDLLTVYGTQLLYPLSSTRVSLRTTFVIDPLFTAVIAISLAAALHRGDRRIAAAGLLLLVAYVGGQWLLRLQALRVAGEAARAQIIEPGPVAALPQPFSPFNWKLVATQASGLRVAHLNLIGHPALVPRLPGLASLHAIAQAYEPPDRLAWERRSLFGDEPQLRTLAESLWRRPDFAAFRHFAVYPALSRIDDGDGRRCVWFTDLRYDLPALPDTFRYGHCQVPPGAPWRLFRLRYFTEHGLEPLTRSGSAKP
ncbi:MAG TPA: metal-dependent hydrolase [Caldimonas sp.]|nr:metal-dependent hydrolase [Caldimonas sp.]HEX2539694.1 metal-dependent hydrolase [Caldimonas sp.]